METNPRSFSEFAILREQLADAIWIIADVFESLDASLLASELRKKHAHLLDDSFRIIFFGEMSRGKSTLINALLGEKILPARNTRCTAIPCNVKYAKDRHAVLHRRPPHPPETIDLTHSPTALKDAVTIPLGEYAGEEIDPNDILKLHPYLEADIFAPIDICKDGVELQDSAGLNEAPERTAETLQKLEDADAVVYVLSCMQPVSESEAIKIRELCDRRHTRDIFFVLNFVDSTWDEPGSMEELKSDTEPRIRRIAGYNTTILYTAAKQGLLARQRNEKDLLDQSGIPIFEKAVKSYLMEYRLISKLRGPLVATEDAINDGVLDLLLHRERLLREPTEELRRKLERAQPELQAAENRRLQILAAFDRHTRLIENEIGIALQSFGVKLENGVSHRIKDVPLSTWDTVARRDNAKKRIARMVELWMIEEAEEWQDNTLSPLLDNRMDDLRQEITRFAVDIQHNIAHAQSILRDPSLSEDLSKEEEVSATSRIIGAGLGILGGPGTFLEGASLGIGSAARGLAANVLVGVVMTAALGISAPIVGVALLGIGALRVVLGAESVANKLRSKLTETLRSSIRECLPQIQADLVTALRTDLKTEQTRIDKLVSATIHELTEQIEGILEERANGEDDLQVSLQILNEQRQILLQQKTILSDIRDHLDQNPQSTKYTDIGEQIAEKLEAFGEKIIDATRSNNQSDKPTLIELKSVLGDSWIQLSSVRSFLEGKGRWQQQMEYKIARAWAWGRQSIGENASTEDTAFRTVTALAISEGKLKFPEPSDVRRWYLKDSYRADLITICAQLKDAEYASRFADDALGEFGKAGANFCKAYERSLKKISPNRNHAQLNWGPIIDAKWHRDPYTHDDLT